MFFISLNEVCKNYETGSFKDKRKKLRKATLLFKIRIGKKWQITEDLTDVATSF